MKKLMASLCASALFAVGAGATQATAAPIVTGGLVNVTVVDVIDDITISDNNVAVGAALNLAANICGVKVNVLVSDLSDGTAVCTNRAGDTEVTITQ